MDDKESKSRIDNAVKDGVKNKKSNELGILKGIENSSLLKARVVLERSSALSALNVLNNSSIIQQIKAMEKLSSSRLSVLETFNYSPVMQQMKTIEKSLSASLKLSNSSISKVLNSFTSSKISTYSDLLDMVVSANAGPLSLGEAYQEIVEGIESMPVSEGIDELSIQVQNKATEAPSGALSTEFYLNLIFALIFFWQSQVLTSESESRLIERMNILETTISTQLHDLAGYERDSTFYVVDRGVNLRVKPTTNSQVISVLYPNMKVRLVERASKWIKIEYFDYKNNIYVSGWAYKKYLKMIKPTVSNRLNQ